MKDIKEPIEYFVHLWTYPNWEWIEKCGHAEEKREEFKSGLWKLLEKVAEDAYKEGKEYVEFAPKSFKNYWNNLYPNQ